MTEQELDLLMRNVLLDAIALEGNAQEPTALGAQSKATCLEKGLKAGRCHTAGDLACVRQSDGR